MREGIVGETQEGFLPGRNTEHHVLTMLQSIKHVHRQGRAAYVLFVDLKKAYDRVHPKALATVLTQSGVPATLVQLYLDRAERRVTRVEVNGVQSDPIHMYQGVGQGDPLSPILFDIFIQTLARRLQQAGLKGVRVGREGDTAHRFIRILELLYADDLAVIVEDPAELQKALDVIDKWCAEYGMEVSTSKGKTEAMCFPAPGAAAPQLPALTFTSPAGTTTQVQWTDSYRYLGFKMTPGLDSNALFAETIKRLDANWRRFFNGGGDILWKSPPALLRDLYNCSVVSACDYLLSVVPPTDDLLAKMDKRNVKAAEWILRNEATGKYASACLLAEAGILPARMIVMRDRIRMYHQLRHGTIQRNSVAAKLVRVLENLYPYDPVHQRGRRLRVVVAPLLGR